MRLLLGYLAFLLALYILHKVVIAFSPLITVLLLFWLIRQFSP